jgi:hypothetical protein
MLVMIASIAHVVIDALNTTIGTVQLVVVGCFLRSLIDVSTILIWLIADFPISIDLIDRILLPLLRHQTIECGLLFFFDG